MEMLGDIDSLGPEVFPHMHICVKASEAKFYFEKGLKILVFRL